MNKMQKLVRIYKVGKLLHMFAVIAILLSFYSGFQLLTIDYSSQPNEWLIWAIAFVIFTSQIVFAELDGYSRYQNYKQIKDQIFINGYQERLLKPLERSSCQREAAILAGDELNLGNVVKNYYWKKGYRWYHIIPDFVFQYPLFFFSAYFWRTTFFTPYYKQKIDYDNIDLSGIDLIFKGNQLEPAA